MATRGQMPRREDAKNAVIERNEFEDGSRAEDEREIDAARQRQELQMRWLVMATTLLLVLAPGVAAMVNGVSAAGISAHATGVALLTWIVRRLFPHV